MPETLTFYVLAALAVGASALVVGQRNPMYSVLLLIASFGALAGLYIQLDAPFVAVAQIIIYAGAIMVLFLFVVMLLNAPQEDAAEWDRTHPLRKPRIAAFGALLAFLLVAQLAWAVLRIADLDVPVATRGDAGTISSVAELGRVLFQRHGFAFEATSILILVAMIGAVVLARREGPDTSRREERS
jgi:NADH-quinone oxidoreductase subunit J